MRLHKYHGLGNDFLVLLDVKESRPVDATLAVAVCDRHRGVGADGLIRVTPGGNGADLTMELRNADGGRAETSGNGLRCLVRAAVDAGLVTGDTVVVATDAGNRRAILRSDGQVSVQMGAVRLVDGAEGVPHSGRVDASWSGFVDAGNPHAVVGLDSLDALAAADVETDGRAWERTSGGINVEYVVAGPAPDGLTMRVWERGVGETRSSGTSAVAVAAAFGAPETVVRFPGGDLRVRIAGGRAFLTGPAERIE